MGRCGTITALIFAVIFAYPLQQTFFPSKRFSVENTCAIITGGSGGLGSFIAGGLAAAGSSKIIITGRKGNALAEVLERLEKSFPDTKFSTVQGDVTNDSDRKALYKRAIEFCGSDTMILVNNAGVEAFQHFDGPQMAKWIDRTIDINVKGLLHLTREFLPRMMEGNKGHVINIASVAGKMSGPFVNVYSASKFSIIGFNRGMRAEMQAMKKDGVTFSAVCPGFVSDVGMAANGMKGGWEATLGLYGHSEAKDTANAVVQAIEYDEPELIVNFGAGRASRFLIVMGEIFPRFHDWLEAVKAFFLPKINEFFFLMAARYN